MDRSSVVRFGRQLAVAVFFRVWWLSLLVCGVYVLFGSPRVAIVASMVQVLTIIVVSRAFGRLARRVHDIHLVVQAVTPYRVHLPGMFSLLGGLSRPEAYLDRYLGMLEAQRIVYEASMRAAERERRAEASKLKELEAFLTRVMHFVQHVLPGACRNGTLPDGVEEELRVALDESLGLEDRRRALMAARRIVRQPVASAPSVRDRPEVTVPIPPSPPQPTEEERLLAKIEGAYPALSGDCYVRIGEFLDQYRALVARGEKRPKLRLYPLRRADDILSTAEAQRMLRQAAREQCCS